MEAQWQANQINISWYNGDSQISPSNSAAGQCTYDQAMTLPSNTLTKQGYTFDGWTVKAAAAQCQGVACYDLLLNGIGFASKGKRSNNNADYCKGVVPNSGSTSDCSNGIFSGMSLYEWKVNFDYGTVKGTTACTHYYNAIKYDTGDPNSGTYNSKRYYCWCKATEIDGVSQSLPWVSFSGLDGTEASCLQDCAHMCGLYAYNQDSLLRAAIYGEKQNVSDCTAVTGGVNACVASYNSSSSAKCLWDVNEQACYNTRVSDCTTITDENRCGSSEESWDYTCIWNGSSCESFYND